MKNPPTSDRRTVMLESLVSARGARRWWILAAGGAAIGLVEWPLRELPQHAPAKELRPRSGYLQHHHGRNDCELRIVPRTDESAHVTGSDRGVRTAAAWSLRSALPLDSLAMIELQHQLAQRADQSTGQMQLAAFAAARNDSAAEMNHYRKANAGQLLRALAK